MTSDSSATFCGLTGDYSAFERSKIVVLPVPFDLTSSWLKGADKGPAALIAASMKMELYDIETDSMVYLLGIHTAEPVAAKSSEAMVEAVYGKVKSYLSEKKYVVTLGGEHSVSIGAVRAHAERFPNLSVLHLDAHSDRRDVYGGERLSHACAVARIGEFAPDVVSVGVRSMDSSEKVERDRMFFAHEIVGDSEWAAEAVDLLSDNVYVTVDLDVFDPSLMPSTGTPEPGGLDWYAVSDFLSFVAAERNIVGFDVVELAPSEHNKAPDFLAAKLVYRILSEVFAKEKA